MFSQVEKGDGSRFRPSKLGENSQKLLKALAEIKQIYLATARTKPSLLLKGETPRLE